MWMGTRRGERDTAFSWGRVISREQSRNLHFIGSEERKVGLTKQNTSLTLEYSGERLKSPLKEQGKNLTRDA